MVSLIELGDNAQVTLDEDTGTLIITADASEIDVGNSDLTAVSDLDAVSIQATSATVTTEPSSDTDVARLAEISVTSGGGDLEIQVNGTDGAGIINFITE